MQIIVASTTLFLAAGRFGLTPSANRLASPGLKLSPNNSGLKTGDPAGVDSKSHVVVVTIIIALQRPVWNALRCHVQSCLGNKRLTGILPDRIHCHRRSLPWHNRTRHCKASLQLLMHTWTFVEVLIRSVMSTSSLMF